MKTELGRMLLSNRFRIAIDGIAGNDAIEVILPEAHITSTSAKKPIVEHGSLTIRRALTQRCEFYTWWNAARLSEQPADVRQVRVDALDDHGKPQLSWIFHEAAPQVYSTSPFNAAASGILIETIELSFRDFEILIN